MPTDGASLLPTKLVKVSPFAVPEQLVYTDSAFEIRVVGMVICGIDDDGGVEEKGKGNGSGSGSKRRMLRKIINGGGGRGKEGGEKGGCGMMKKDLVLLSTRSDYADGGADSSSVIPLIHYDFRKEGSLDNGLYGAVPDSKSLIVRSAGNVVTKYVNFRFQLVEIEDYDRVKPTLEDVDKFNANLGLYSHLTPYVSILAPFVRYAGSIGSKAIDDATKPNRVLDTDLSYRLAARDCPLAEQQGDSYLRYGYYFFLSNPTRERLYTQVSTPKHLTLFTKTRNGIYEEPKDLSYVVVHVTRPLADPKTSMRPPLRVEDVERLREILRTAHVVKAEDVKRSVTKLVEDIGGIDAV